MQKSIFISFSFLLLSAAWADTPKSSDSDYCVAIRGNGQNAPAHWASMARMVEEKGMPKKMAGGSSAAVTMFFLDSMAGNPALKNITDETQKRKMQALLIKSMPEFTAMMAQDDSVVSAYSLMNNLADNKSPLSKKLNALINSGKPVTADAISRAFGKFAPLLNPEVVEGLVKNPQFFQKEIQDAVKDFGKFDAEKDANLFVRPGLVDFKYFSVVLGAMADFYAGNGDAATNKALEAYMLECADTAYQKQWNKIGDCKTKFQKIAKGYLAKANNPANFPNKALFKKVGTNITSIPSTALVREKGKADYEELKRAYDRGDADKDYSKFSVGFGKDDELADLSFGYFGSKEVLGPVKRGLGEFRDEGNLKSKKFEAIGAANWFEVLATSPAEPGLANLQRIPVGTTRAEVLSELKKSPTSRWDGLDYSDEYLSAGGWSDLHPTEVLRASGCDTVAYLTRRDGEAIFGQQVFIRLTGEQDKIPFWNQLGENNNSGWKVSGSAQDTAWNKLYNYGNPRSSFNRAIANANIVYCTDWNNYEPFNGEMWPMVDEAYLASVLLKTGTPASYRFNPPKWTINPSRYPGCVANGPGGSMIRGGAPTPLKSAE